MRHNGWILLLAVLASVPLSGPLYGLEKPIKVAIYREDADGYLTYGDWGIHQALTADPEIQPAYIMRMDPETLRPFSVLIIPEGGWKTFNYAPSNWQDIVRQWVGEGHGVMPLHDVIGCRYHKWQLFPEIATGAGVREERECVIAINHPITKSFTQMAKQIFRHDYADHIYMALGKQGIPVVCDLIADETRNRLEIGDPVVVAGAYGKGRVLVNGMATGWAKEEREAAPTGGEKNILVDGVKWLAGNGPVTTDTLDVLVKGTLMGPAQGTWEQGPDGLVRTALPIAAEQEADIRAMLSTNAVPSLKGKKAKEIVLGIWDGGRSEVWKQMLTSWGYNARIIRPTDLPSALSAVSILIMADAPMEKKYLPVVENFLHNGGKLVVTEKGGYDRERGKYHLVNIIHAGKFTPTASAFYQELFMPEDIKSKEIDPRRQAYVLDQARVALENGAAGLAYFTLNSMRKPEEERRWFPGCSVLENGSGTADFTRELNLITRMAPVWSQQRGPVLRALPAIVQIGYDIDWPCLNQRDPVRLAEYCWENGVNVVAYQISCGEAYLRDEGRPHMTRMILKRLSPELQKRGIQLWLNSSVPPLAYYIPPYTNHVEECQVDVNGKIVALICPVRGVKSLNGYLGFLEMLFSEFPYFNGIDLDEPRLTQTCYCPECRQLFARLNPGKKYDENNPESLEFQKFVVAEYMVKPHADFLRRVRPHNGVLSLAAPGIENPRWSLDASKLADVGVQLFLNENALKKEQTQTDTYYVKHTPQSFAFNRIEGNNLVLLNGIKREIKGQAVKCDVFWGGEAAAYVSDGNSQYPGIIIGTDHATVYYAFDPLISGETLIANSLQWFLEAGRYDCPKGMGVVSGGSFEMSVLPAAADAFWLPDNMAETQTNIPSFSMDKYEITNKDYERFDPKHRRSEFSVGDSMPVVNVSWPEAALFCNWRSRQEGLEPVYGTNNVFSVDLAKNGYRLPSAAEWQKAAKGTEHYKYAWGNTWWRSEGRVGVPFEEGTVNVGTYQANKYGLYDLTGNVWEWVNDRAQDGKMICGGCWHSDAVESRVEFYNFLHTDALQRKGAFQCRSPRVGFRCVQNVTE